MKNKNLIILSINVVVIAAYLFFHNYAINHIIDNQASNTETSEVMLQAAILKFNAKSYKWIGIICLALFLFNLITLRSSFKFKKCLGIAVLSFIISYGASISFITWKGFETKEIIENKQRPT